MDSYNIGHLRDSEGFVKTWYDKENDDGSTTTYKFSPKAVTSDVYVSVENYPDYVVPESCLNSPHIAFASL